MLKLILLFSIVLNTVGLSGPAASVDKSASEKTADRGSQISASVNLLDLPEISTSPVVRVNAIKPIIYAGNYILIDAESGTILLKKNEKVQVPIASTTKVMTAVLVLENYNLNDVLTVSKDSADLIDSGLKVGEQMTVLNLLKCLLINSYNGAAYTLAENANNEGGTGDARFIEMMNAKARELGMENTDYRDAAGLDVTGYSTAYDLTLVTKYAMQKKLFDQIVATPTETVTDVTGKISHQLTNSNRLVTPWNYPGILGIKTGYMDEAGHCLVAAARRSNHTIISVVLNTVANTPTASAEESRKLLDWGFNNVLWQ